MSTKVFYKIFFGLAFFTFFITPTFLYAASIYLVPPSGSYTVGEQFSISVFVSSGAQEMNAVKATVESSNSNLQLISVSQSGSIIDFWAQEPQINGDGAVYFEGVMLGKSYSGSAGKLATILVRARSVGDVTLAVSFGSVLANDGFGTELPTDLGTADFYIGPVKAVSAAATIPDGFVFTKDLRQIDTGSEVRYLQICLKNQGFYTEDVTGYFGTQTKQAVIDFQEHYYDDILAPNGFSKGTGMVGEFTREKLNEVCFVAPVVEDIEQPYATTTLVPAPIEITEEKDAFYINIWFWVGMTAVLAMVIILLLIIIIALLLRQTSELRQRHQRQTLRKEEVVLRRAHKNLLMTKVKIEKEVQKAENKLKKFSKEGDS